MQKPLFFILGLVVVISISAAGFYVYKYKITSQENVVLENITPQEIRTENIKQETVEEVSTYDFKIIDKFDTIDGKLNEIDSERTRRAQEVLGPDFNASWIAISSERFVVLQEESAPNNPIHVIDIVNKQRTDKFTDSKILYTSPKAWLIDEGGNSLSLYVFGSEKRTPIQDSKLKENETYTQISSEYGGYNNAVILATTTNTITVGIYDLNESINTQPDRTQYKQIGQKIFTFPN